MIKNPILPGFNPDPSIVRVGDDYYIATSTFEWFPGVQIHHSRDLKNWHLAARPLDRVSQLDMIGNPDSGGIWAPCLSYSDGLFYLIYTDVKNWDASEYKVAHNYLVTAESVEGPWSEPIYLDSTGFDASLFHDDDGRKWYVSMIWDHRKKNHSFQGTLLQEYSVTEKKLVGPRKNIFKGSPRQLTEGPHLYKINGYYYLLVAEGGTWYTHAATMARSRNIDGPYEIDPIGSYITADGVEDAPLQKTGHASIVETQKGDWYTVHLCGRPLRDKRCILGRETAIQKCVWSEDGWLRLAHGGVVSALETEGPDLPEQTWESQAAKDDFNEPKLQMAFQSLRRPVSDEWLSLSARPGWLRLMGEEPTISTFRQSLIARRVEHFNFVAETCVDFDPESFQHMAGLICYYNTRKHYYLYISHDEDTGRCLNILRSVADEHGEILKEDIRLPATGLVYLRAEMHREALQFSYSLDKECWTPVGPELDATILSDDFDKLSFTGAFVGLCCQDLTGQRRHADFDYLNLLQED